MKKSQRLCAKQLECQDLRKLFKEQKIWCSDAYEERFLGESLGFPELQSVSS